MADGQSATCPQCGGPRAADGSCASVARIMGIQLPAPAPAAGTGDEREGLREALAQCIAGANPESPWWIADALLAGPLADLLAAQEAVRDLRTQLQRLTEERDELDRQLAPALDGTEP